MYQRVQTFRLFTFFKMWIAHFIKDRLLTLSVVVLGIMMEGTVSQIF